MDIQVVLTTVASSAIIGIGSYISNRIREMVKLAKETNRALDRLQLLFEVEIPPMKSDIKDLKSNVTFINTKLPRR